MKTAKIMSVFAALLMQIPAFVSCDKEDEGKDDPNQPAADVSKITGTYYGSLGYSVMGFEPGKIEGSYELQILKDSEDADEVTVVLPECSCMDCKDDPVS